jgi:4-hydroxythreonine-4-phosphate dehydrogenase
MRKRRLVLTMGDPAGIGPEIILRALSRERVRRMADFLILGNRRVLEETADRMGVPFGFAVSDSLEDLPATGPCLLQSDRLGDCPVLPGRPSARTGRASLSYILRGAHLCMEGRADGMVTAPVCKSALRKAGCRYPGHTEIIADLTGAEKVVMMLAGGGLRVALVTTHVSVAALPQLVTRGEICATLLVTARDLRRSFGIESPRIAVLGLNPHAGEEGMLGGEEATHIIPAIRTAGKKGIRNLSGPLPADTAFHRMLRGEFDCIVAMYHDQGLGPLKTVAFEKGVNITLGLPIVRTSVDHGTAFDIAGANRAADRSLVEAIRVAVRMARARTRAPEKE